MIFSSEIQRPSSAKLWQIPQPTAFPIPPFLDDREVPLDAQETSYLADSASIFNFSSTVSFIPNTIDGKEDKYTLFPVEEEI